MLRAADAGRLPELLPIRYYRMSQNPFGFLRGAAAVMARDLASAPTTGLRVQMAGDAHVGNFGLFATPERDQVFDANDFDETLPGPWENDLKRLATSLVLAGRLQGSPGHRQHEAVRAAVGAYQSHLRSYAAATYLDTWYAHLDLESVRQEVGRPGRRLFRRAVDEARDRTGFRAFPRLAEPVRGRYRIRDDPPLIHHLLKPGDEAMVRGVFDEYRESLAPERRELYDRYRLEDVALKVVGVGSVGTRCAVGLFLADPDVLDPVFLQVKESLPAAAEPYVGASRFTSHSERVVVGQRLIQEASDVFLGFGSSRGHDFYVRQLRDMKFSSELSALGPKAILGQAELCGAALARAHARTGDPAAIAGYLGDGPGFDEAIVRFAEAYAAQTERDHAELVRALADGRLPTSEPDPRDGARTRRRYRTPT